MAEQAISVCPCCGQSWVQGRSKADARRILNNIIVPPESVKGRVLECLLKNFGEWVPRARLVDYVYRDDRNGGPDDANNTIAAHVNRVRVSVRKYGFELDGVPRWGSRLRWASGPQEARAH